MPRLKMRKRERIKGEKIEVEKVGRWEGVRKVLRTEG
jgi:hypothetical protein